MFPRSWQRRACHTRGADGGGQEPLQTRHSAFAVESHTHKAFETPQLAAPSFVYLSRLTYRDLSPAVLSPSLFRVAPLQALAGVLRNQLVGTKTLRREDAKSLCVRSDNIIRESERDQRHGGGAELRGGEKRLGVL